MAEIFLILGLILLNGLFAMAEISLISSRKARLESQAAKGDKKAQEALKLSLHPDTFLSTVSIGITLIGILNGIFSGEKLKAGIVQWLNHYPSLQHYSNGIGTAIIVIIITYFTLVIGELLPKRIGLSNPEKFAKLLAGPMRIVSLITFPFIWLLSKSTNVLVKLMGIKRNDTQVTEEEIKAIISEGTEHGAIEEAEQEIIERVFHLGDRNITSLMTHRTDITWLDINSKVKDAKNIIKESAFSVYPVCEGSIDNIKGVVSLKDIFFADDETPIRSLCKTGMYVPENNSAYQVLEKFKECKAHYTFIVDEYGSVQGLITLNDILDAIVGNVTPPDANDYEITKRDDNSFLVDAQIPFYNFLSYFEKTDWLSEDERHFDTLAGFILDVLERIPATGDKFSWKDFHFEIIDMDNHRIDKVLVILESGRSENESDDESEDE
ncbi:MAG: HlyC/CorC family transporter [Chitinophagaceae bacterium]|nr:HlyC/CorC family transporter [Chitinophagaceae bacterium]